MRAAADLIDAGCDSGYINRVMFDTKTKKHIQLEKELYDNIIYCCNDQCAIIHTTLEMEKTMEKLQFLLYTKAAKSKLWHRQKKNTVCLQLSRHIV